MRFYWGGKNFINKIGLFYATFFEFEVKSYSPFFSSSIQPQHTVIEQSEQEVNFVIAK